MRNQSHRATITFERLYPAPVEPVFSEFADPTGRFAMEPLRRVMSWFAMKPIPDKAGAISFDAVCRTTASFAARPCITCRPKQARRFQ